MVQPLQGSDPFSPPIAGRSGTSPIGTSSPNSGSSGNTNSAYAPNAFTSGVNVQGPDDPGGGTAYTLQNTDYQGLILFNTASAVAVTLNYALGDNFVATILNTGSGAMTLTPIIPPADSGSTLYTVNGATSLTLPSGAGCIVAFAQRLWYAYVGATFIPIVPVTFTPITGEFLTGYNSATGAFSAAFTPGLSTTVTLAKLTTGGANGSMTITHGLVTAYTAPS
jgi:hypothetical protein